MKDAELRERMTARLLAAQTPWGRARLNFYVKWKRVAWNFTTGFAYFLKRVFDIGVSLIAIVLLAPVFLGIAIAEQGNPHCQWEGAGSRRAGGRLPPLPCRR